MATTTTTKSLFHLLRPLNFEHENNALQARPPRTSLSISADANRGVDGETRARWISKIIASDSRPGRTGPLASSAIT